MIYSKIFRAARANLWRILGGRPDEKSRFLLGKNGRGWLFFKTFKFQPWISSPEFPARHEVEAAGLMGAILSKMAVFLKENVSHMDGERWGRSWWKWQFSLGKTCRTWTVKIYRGAYITIYVFFYEGVRAAGGRSDQKLQFSKRKSGFALPQKIYGGDRGAIRPKIAIFKEEKWVCFAAKILWSIFFMVGPFIKPFKILWFSEHLPV